MMDIKLFCFSCMEKLDDPNQICPSCGHDNHIRTNAHDQLPNSVVGKRYLIGRALGRGGFGITYIGRDLMLNRKIAVKEFFPHNLVTRMTGASTIAAVDDERGELFARGKVDALQEAQIIAKLGQIPHTVSVFDIFEANNSFYIVMEYIDGLTLRKYVEKSGGKLTPKEALDMLHPLFATLSRVHRQGVIHRDISPDNIMVQGETDEVVLLDFGAARIVDEQEETLSINPVFRSGYAPLEQYIRRVRLTPRTDEYALCATLFFCVTGQKPQDAQERAYDEDHLVMPEDVASQLKPHQLEAMTKGLSLKAADRYETIGELEEALYQKSTNQPEQEQKKAEKVEPHEVIPKKPWIQRFKKKSIIISLAASVVVGGILLGVGLWGKRAEPTANTDLTLAPLTAEITAAVPESTATPTENPTETPTETTSPEELFTLGYNYENGLGGVAQDYEKAVEYYQLAADQNHADAEYYLGKCYELGNGVEKSFEQAVYYYEKAAVANDCWAQYRLGICYQYGNGVTKDTDKANEYFALAGDEAKKNASLDIDAEYEKLANSTPGKGIDVPARTNLGGIGAWTGGGFEAWLSNEVYPTAWLTATDSWPDFCYLSFPLPDDALPREFDSRGVQCFFPDRDIEIEYNLTIYRERDSVLYEKDIKNSIFITGENGIEILVYNFFENVFEFRIKLDESFANSAKDRQRFLLVKVTGYNHQSRDEMIQIGREEIRRILNVAQIKQLDHPWSEGLYSSIVLVSFYTNAKLDTSEMSLLATDATFNNTTVLLPWSDEYVEVNYSLSSSSGNFDNQLQREDDGYCQKNFQVKNKAEILIKLYDYTGADYEAVLDKAYSYVKP